MDFFDITRFAKWNTLTRLQQKLLITKSRISWEMLWLPVIRAELLLREHFSGTRRTGRRFANSVTTLGNSVWRKAVQFLDVMRVEGHSILNIIGTEMAGRRQIPVERRLANSKITKAEAEALLRNMPPRIEGTPEPPAWMSGYALEGFRRFSNILFQRNQLSIETETSLIAMAQCYGDWVDLAKDLRDNGYIQVVTTENGPIERTRPTTAAFADADRRLKAWLTEFGLTDASRGKVTAGEAGAAEEDDPLARYNLN
jgi:P27 family predicted phage terminase small subunit